MRERLGDEAGFSLTEMAVACALLMIVLFPMLRYFDSSISGAAELQRSTQQHADARVAVDRLARELRQAYTGTDRLSPVTVTHGGLGLTFYSPDTSTPYRLRQIDYLLQDGQLQRRVIPSDQTSCPPPPSVTPPATVPSCAAFGPEWTFTATGTEPWVPVMEARINPAFTAAVVNGAVRRIDIQLTGLNSRGRADRPVQLSLDLRNV
ncbi:MAG: hypothetical protein JWO68_237 [Actinomycetia bacterium]|nr:hypothetical protein [Actinomycetes bacterium]